MTTMALDTSATREPSLTPTPTTSDEDEDEGCTSLAAFTDDDMTAASSFAHLTVSQRKVLVTGSIREIELHLSPTTSRDERDEDEVEKEDNTKTERCDKDKPMTAVERLQLFYPDEIIRGDCLGKGSFGQVFAIEQFQPLSENDSEFDKERLHARRSYVKIAPGKQQHYAVKFLREFDKPKVFEAAAKDMETEADLLAELNHPHVIRLYAKSAVAKGSTMSSDYFLVLDQLSSTTLQEKIGLWKRRRMQMSSGPVFFRPSAGKQKKELLVERLRIMQDVADAVDYLHRASIIYRDLKPDNVGFDTHRQCKLFDFGLARRLPVQSDSGGASTRSDTFKMSGTVGSLFFMAPEVYMGKPYNSKADVYSMAILLWNVLALDWPYLDVVVPGDKSAFAKAVMVGGHRPKIDPKWPKALQQLLQEAWASKMEDRPSMQQVHAKLKEVVAELTSVPTASAVEPARAPVGRIKRSSYL